MSRRGTIDATPNPAPFDTRPGTSSISWAVDAVDAVVTVSVDGGEESLFARGASGAADAPWIEGGRRYAFALRTGGKLKTVATVEVAMEPPPPSDSRQTDRPFITASPNPVPNQTDAGTTIVSWSTAGRGSGLVTVHALDGDEVPFGRGAEGLQDAGWIKPGPVYVFRLYADAARTERLAAVTVTMASPLRERVLDIAVVGAAAGVVAAAVALPVALAVRLARRVGRR